MYNFFFRCQFQFFRMSLSWSRILPTNNPSHVNHEAIEHYRKVFDEVERQGMEVFLTIYHWDHPVALDERGGWREEFMVDAFTEYATVVFDYFSDRIKFWTTINEPAAYCTYGHGKGYFPPGELFRFPFKRKKNTFYFDQEIYFL